MSQLRYKRSTPRHLRFILWVIVSLLLLCPQPSWSLSASNPPVTSLLNNFPANSSSSNKILAATVVPLIEPQIKVYQQGDVEYAYVTLDGTPIFPVTANITPAAKPNTGSSPVQHRVQSIEPTLYRIVESQFDPQNLYVTVASLDRQTIILAGDQTRNTQEIILTVTELDAQFAEKPISALAKDWADQIHQALLRGKADRRPEARQRQVIQIGTIAMSIFAASAILYGVQQWIYWLFRRRKQFLQQSFEALLPLDSDAASQDLARDFKQAQALKQRQTLNILLRRLLRLTQLGIWSGGIAWILLTFPETRGWGEIIIAFVIKLCIVLLTMLLVAQICRFWVNQRLRAWVEEVPPGTDELQRVVLRAPTLAGVFDQIIKVLAWCIAIVLLIDWEQVPIASLWTGAGLLGVALSLVFQNLLRDWLNGFLIIFGDQYAVGDTVTLANTTGFVEGMSLRSTQIRGEGGSLNIIPHGQITTVKNLTKDWSRVDFTIQVAKETDVAKPMEIMKQVAESLALDPEWQSAILEPANLIGIDRINSSGTQIVIWIKTKRSKQWEVEREFRHRLKLAFDQQGIQMA